MGGEESEGSVGHVGMRLHRCHPASPRRAHFPPDDPSLTCAGLGRGQGDSQQQDRHRPHLGSRELHGLYNQCLRNSWLVPRDPVT